MLDTRGAGEVTVAVLAGNVKVKTPGVPDEAWGTVMVTTVCPASVAYPSEPVELETDTVAAGTVTVTAVTKSPPPGTVIVTGMTETVARGSVTVGTPSSLDEVDEADHHGEGPGVTVKVPVQPGTVPDAPTV